LKYDPVNIVIDYHCSPGSYAVWFKHEQCWVGYGLWGFIEAKSDRNMYTLTLRISESDPFFGDKLDIAETNGLGETADFDIVSGNPLPPALLPYLRLVTLGGTDAFLLESIYRNTIWGHLEVPVSRSNEELICRVVRDWSKRKLKTAKQRRNTRILMKEKGSWC